MNKQNVAFAGVYWAILPAFLETRFFTVASVILAVACGVVWLRMHKKEKAKEQSC